MTSPPNSAGFFSRHPLALAAALFLLGAALGRWLNAPGWVLATGAASAWGLWAIAEWTRRTKVAPFMLAVSMVAGGAAAWTFNQSQIEADHIARFLPAEGETLVTLRGIVDVPAAADSTHGGSRFVARAIAIWTDRGWMPASGDVLVNWSAAPGAAGRGDVLEMEGWLERPPKNTNPGGFDARHALAADRIFATLRVPRAGGVRVLDRAEAPRPSLLARVRLFLRGKLLEHVVQEDVPAAYTLTTLFLGYRDPIIRDVSQAFSDAGIAHLLAISGSHVIFFAGLVWVLLRYLPLRPRLRETLVVAATAAYVLATPCGPPVVRAFIALLGVLLARLLGRPGSYLNILCGAAVAVVLLRPMDLEDAGFQLSFVSAAALILLAPRVHAALFGPWLARETLAAELARRPWIFWRLRILRLLLALVTANVVASLAAAPLVAYHFGQFNPWAIVTGILALPVVCLAMVAAAGQLLAGLLGMGALLAPLSAFAGSFLVAWVRILARLPAAAVPLRQPPMWLVAAAYAVLLLWIARQRYGVSRATVCNALATLAVAAAVWRALAAPTRQVDLLALDAGDGSCILLRTPAGRLWLIDAGHGPSAAGALLDDALVPAMRVAGARQLEGLILTRLDGAHAAEAGDVVARYHPEQVWLPARAWQNRGETLAGASLAHALGEGHPVGALARGQALDLGDGCTVQVLWPEQQVRDSPNLILVCAFAGRHVLVADPRQAALLPGLVRDSPLDAAIFTGPPRDDPALQIIRQPIPRGQVIWSGRNHAMGNAGAPGDLDTHDGACRVQVTARGIVVSQEPDE